MSDGGSDPLMTAAARLEQAVERLAEALSRPRPQAAALPEDMVPRAELAALSARLDATLAKLRAALRDQAGADDGDDEGED